MRVLKKVTLLFLVLVSLFQVVGVGQMSFAPHIAKADTEYTTFGAVLEWRYKAIDGKLYRRQYNRSTGQYIGEWELCP